MPPHSAMTDDELLQNLEDSTNNAADHQLRTLHSILQYQAAVGYLHPYFSGSELPSLDPATFRRQVPLSSYDDYADQINQMADNNHQSQPPFLSVDPLLCFFYSFQNVVRNAMAAEMVEFACFFDLQSTPKQLKVFVEVEDVCERLSGSVEALEGCCSSVEKGLGSFYQVQRAKGDIGPLLVFFVRPGSFGRILAMAIKNGAPTSQYKPPNIIRNPEIDGFMENSALAVVCLDSTD